MNPIISVIIPSFNSEKTIKACLASLLNQSIKSEIIVIDDGSTDKTAAIVKTFSGIKFLTQSHQGPAIARNLGAKNSHGEILVFVDSDMEFDINFLQDSTAPIVDGKSKGSWSGNESVRNWNSVWARCWNYNQNRFTPKMTGNKGQRRVFRAILKSEFDKVNGFDAAGYTDDWSLVKKLGYQPTVTQAEFYHYNPDTLLKIFFQASWIGKRQYKLGKLGTILTMLKSNAAFSVSIGLFKSIIFINPQFLIFKLIYDLGIFVGAFENLCFGFYY